MFSYNIEIVADNAAFKRACAQIESKMSSLKKLDLLIDVDGTLIQVYYTKGGKIVVKNDYLVDAVYVDSEVDLTHIFGGLECEEVGQL